MKRNNKVLKKYSSQNKGHSNMIKYFFKEKKNNLIDDIVNVHEALFAAEDSMNEGITKVLNE